MILSTKYNNHVVLNHRSSIMVLHIFSNKKIISHIYNKNPITDDRGILIKNGECFQVYMKDDMKDDIIMYNTLYGTELEIINIEHNEIEEYIETNYGVVI